MTIVATLLGRFVRSVSDVKSVSGGGRYTAIAHMWGGEEREAFAEVVCATVHRASHINYCWADGTNARSWLLENAVLAARERAHAAKTAEKLKGWTT